MDSEERGAFDVDLVRVLFSTGKWHKVARFSYSTLRTHYLPRKLLMSLCTSSDHAVRNSYERRTQPAGGGRGATGVTSVQKHCSGDGSDSESDSGSDSGDTWCELDVAEDGDGAAEPQHFCMNEAELAWCKQAHYFGRSTNSGSHPTMISFPLAAQILSDVGARPDVVQSIRAATNTPLSPTGSVDGPTAARALEHCVSSIVPLPPDMPELAPDQRGGAVGDYGLTKSQQAALSAEMGRYAHWSTAALQPSRETVANAQATVKKTCSAVHRVLGFVINVLNRSVVPSLSLLTNGAELGLYAVWALTVRHEAQCCHSAFTD